MDMQIIIPTHGRQNKQLTLSFLSKNLRKRTTIVCPKREVFSLESLGEDIKVVAQPDPNWKIAAKRQWIMKEWLSQGFEKIIMLDDDLRFTTRKSDTDWHLREVTKEELEGVFNLLEEKLGPEFPHVGFGMRQGNNTVENPGWKTPAKQVCTLGYYLPIVLQECELNRIETREDMDVTLQLLRKGYPNAVWQETVCDQREFAASGGCSIWRTIESTNKDALQLADLHPEYVSVVKRTYKASIDRLEVVIQWRKALEDGLRAKNSTKGEQ